MKRHDRFAIFALMLVTAMAAFASEPQDRPPQEGEATLARQRLQLSLAYEGGPPVMITIRDGEVGRLRHLANGLAFRLKATYDPIERNAVVTFYDLENWDDETSSTDDATVNIPLTAVNIPLAAEAVRVPEVTSQSSSGARLASLQVGFIGFAAPAASGRGCSGSGLDKRSGFIPRTNRLPNGCCMNCNGWTVCGCAVACGGNSCCIEGCC